MMASQTPYRTMPSFPPPKINSRPQLSPCLADFVGGDFVGLQALATGIYSFVSSSNSGPFSNLVADVTRMVKDDNDPSGGYHPGADGGWIGVAAYTFRSAFVADAAMMNGLNRTMCSVAEQVDGLASGLSSLESALERKLQSIMQKGMSAFNIGWLVTTGSGTHPAFEITAQGAAGMSGFNIPASSIITLCNKLGEPYFEKANTLRAQTATKLAAFGETLVEALHYYAAQSAGAGSPSSGDLNVMLTAQQAGSDSTAANRLESQLKKYTSGLGKSALDDPAVAAALTNMGVKAQNVGAIIGDLKNIKEADSVIDGSKGFIGLLGDAIPLLMAIGLGA